MSVPNLFLIFSAMWQRKIKCEQKFEGHVRNIRYVDALGSNVKLMMY
jgi:hypothetical protein